jgi:hypothetical protein
MIVRSTSRWILSGVERRHRLKISKSVKKTASMFGALTSHWAKPEVLGICFCRPVDHVTGAFGGFGVSREFPPPPNSVSPERI